MTAISNRPLSLPPVVASVARERRSGSLPRPRRSLAQRARSSVLIVALAGCYDGGDPKDVVVDTDDTDAPEALTAPDVRILEQAPTTVSPLTAEVVEPAGDLTYTYSWRSDGAARPDVAGAVVPAEATRKGQVWAVEVAATRGEQVSQPGSAEVTVLNTPPVGSLTIEPQDPSSVETIRAVPSVIDPDEDDVTWVWSWTTDGAASSVASETVPPNATQRGQRWTVTGTPSDGEVTGEPVSSTVIVRNTLPEVTRAVLSPASPRTEVALTGDARAIDVDGDSPTLRFVWLVDGEEVVGQTTSVLGPEHSAKGQTVIFEAIANDGFDDSLPVPSNPIIVQNTPPEIDSVTLQPPLADASSVLACVAEGWQDADADPIDYRYSWTVDGTRIAGLDVATLDNTWFGRGSIISCSAQPDDGEDLGQELSSGTVQISNTPPTLGSVELSSTAPGVGEPLTASAVGQADADGDTITVVFAWFVDDVDTNARGPVFSGPQLVPGAEVYAVGTPYDGLAFGESVESEHAIVANSPPTASGVLIAPTQPRTNDRLIAFVTLDDADGHTVTPTYGWTVDGALVVEGADNFLEGLYFAKGQSVAVSVTPYDGFSDGDTVTSRPVVVLNTAPVLNGASIGPDVVTEETVLTCTPGSWTDADGDAPDYRYSWFVSGDSVAITESSLDGVSFSRGDSVSCTITPWDGETSGGSASSRLLTVQNTPPTLGSVSLSSARPALGDTLFIHVASSSDLDEDPVSFTYVWYLDDVAAGTDATFSTEGLLAGQRVYAEVTPTDGIDTGPPRVTNTATVQNNGPELYSVTLSPVQPTTAQPIVASWVGLDPDGDPVEASFTWLINEAEVPGVDGDTLDATYTSKRDVVQVEVVISDGTVSSDPLVGGPAVVVNSAPSLTGATITPTDPTEISELVCTPLGWSDPDGDPESVAVVWYVNGQLRQTGGALGGASFQRGDSVVCRAIPDDTDLGGRGVAVDAPAVLIGNTAPTVDGVELSTDVPSESLSVGFVALGAEDIDGDVISYNVDWFVDGAEVSHAAVLTGADFDKGSRIGVRITPSDGDLSGLSVSSDQVVAVNSPPVIDSVVIGPDEPGATDTLTATVEVSDADPNDTVTVSLSWWVEGVEVQNSASAQLSPSLFDSGDSIYLVVTPNDGEEDGAALVTTPITIDNSPPSITSVRLSPAAIYETTTVVCEPQGWSDPDGDAPGYHYAWFVNTMRVGAGPTLTGARFDRDDDVYCRATPFDGTSSGPALDSPSATVQNSAPQVTRATLSRVAPREANSISVILQDARDPDGDAIARTYHWFVEGLEVSSADTIDGVLFDRDDEIYCVVDLSDGVETISVTSNTVTVDNTPPRILSLTISPDQVFVTDTVSSTYQVQDDDGDTVEVTWTWLFDDEASDRTSDVLLPGDFIKNQQIKLLGVPSDGLDEGPAITSNTVVSINSPPTVATAEISPIPVTLGVTPVCVGGTTYDADGDAVAVVYQWTVNGVDRLTAPQLPSAFFGRGDELRCSAVPYDNEDFGTPITSDATDVVNALPVISAVALSTYAPTEGSAIFATAQGVEDADGDLVSPRWLWTVDGVPASTASSIDSNSFDRGDVIVATATPFDGFALGTPVSSAPATAVNKPPRMDGVPSIEPTLAYTDTTLSVEASAEDDDGDAVTIDFAWLVGDVEVLSGPTAVSLEGSYFARGDVVRVRTTPNDGFVDGVAVTSSPVTILNSKPVPPSVSISPSNPVPGVDDLVCSLSALSTDSDGDQVSYEFRWRVDNIVFNGATSGANTSTIDGGVVAVREIWQCESRAWDGTAWGAWSASAVAQVGNQSYASCAAHLGVNGYVDGTYLIDPDGGGEMQVECDQTIGGGGWARILRTTTYGENFGQNTNAIVTNTVAVSAPSGVYEAFRRVPGFSEIMIRQVTGAQAGRHAAFNLEGDSGGLTMLEVLETCRDETEYVNNDSEYRGRRVVGHTSDYSGFRFEGDLRVYHQSDGTSALATYVHLCGINQSSDNDVSYLAFTNGTGELNDWGDSWRRDHQWGTIWSFANADYCCGTGNHIGHPNLQAYAGWKGVGLTAPTTWHQGTYEIYIR